MKLSIVIPVYNEALAIREVLTRTCEAEIPAGWEREIIVVDDGSVDTTVTILEAFRESRPEWAPWLRLHQGVINQGKGSAVRVGLKLAQGDVILVQDGDLEYSPKDYMAMLTPFSDPKVKIVFGSRFLAGRPRGMRFPNLVANYILSYSVRILFGHPITDEATAYKVFRKEVISKIDFQCRRFEFCPEFVAKALLAGFSIKEVPIQYNARGVLEGKKIRASDGFTAIWWLVKIRIQGWGNALSQLPAAVKKSVSI